MKKVKGKEGKTKLKKGFSYNTVLKMIILTLLVVLAVFFFKSRADISSVKKDLAALEEQIETQKLMNKDVLYALREDESKMERAAREELDYAHPEEKVFVDVSGIK